MEPCLFRRPLGCLTPSLEKLSLKIVIRIIRMSFVYWQRVVSEANIDFSKEGALCGLFLLGNSLRDEKTDAPSLSGLADEPARVCFKTIRYLSAKP